MPRTRKRPKRPKPRHPNRIAELARARDLTYEEIGDKLGAHAITIAKLATGKIKLTTAWMERLAPVFGVTPAEIAWRPPGQGMRWVKVKGAVQAGAWAESHEWSDDEQREVMIPDDPSLRGLTLYAGEVRGNSMNLRYPPGTVVVFSHIDHNDRHPIQPGRRYHVRQTRPDGLVEETIKTLVRDDSGRYWLKPESDRPEFQQWLPLEGGDGVTVELIGRVRFVVQRED